MKVDTLEAVQIILQEAPTAVGLIQKLVAMAQGGATAVSAADVAAYAKETSTSIAAEMGVTIKPPA